MRVAYVGGGWATNAGNAFYNLGALYALRRVFGRDNVYFLPDLASWIWKTDDAYDVLADVDVDLLVLSGPAFCSNLEAYRSMLTCLAARGCSFAFISVGASEYTSHEVAQVRSVLDAVGDRLVLVSTRDRETHAAYRDLPCRVHDGICTSMFLDDAVVLPDLVRPPYIAMNFAHRVEPSIRYDSGRFTVEPVAARSTAPQRTDRLIRRLRRVGGAAEPRTYPTRIGPFDVLRTQSGPFKRDAAAIFDRPSLHYFDIPTGSLTIYKHAEAVFTDRVHTCASTLILGGAAQYVATTPRSRDGRWFLLDRIGASAVRERPTRLDRSFIDVQKEEMLDVLRSTLTTPARVPGE